MEINAFMNGYKPEGDNEFLKSSLEAHKEVLENTKFDLETTKEFLYQHIQTNKELEKDVQYWKDSCLYHIEGVKELENQIKEIEKVSDYNADLRTELAKALNDIYQITKDIHIKVIIEKAVADLESPSETHTAAHPELYFEK
jgi:hypothetical protein